jgi:hypothetical protein
MAYPGQLDVSRKDETSAARVLYAAVVQNSRKWKVDNVARKKGSRQSGESVRRSMPRVPVTPRARATPKKKERAAMPERDLARWGR